MRHAAPGWKVKLLPRAVSQQLKTKAVAMVCIDYSTLRRRRSANSVPMPTDWGDRRWSRQSKLHPQSIGIKISVAQVTVTKCAMFNVECSQRKLWHWKPFSVLMQLRAVSIKEFTQGKWVSPSSANNLALICEEVTSFTPSKIWCMLAQVRAFGLAHTSKCVLRELATKKFLIKLNWTTFAATSN